MTILRNKSKLIEFFLLLKVYRHNFPNVKHESGNICGLKAETLEKKGVEAIFMSPPCQPFTRQGLKKDLQVTLDQVALNLNP